MFSMKYNVNPEGGMWETKKNQYSRRFMTFPLAISPGQCLATTSHYACKRERNMCRQEGGGGQSFFAKCMYNSSIIESWCYRPLYFSVSLKNTVLHYQMNYTYHECVVFVLYVWRWNKLSAWSYAAYGKLPARDMYLSSRWTCRLS